MMLSKALPSWASRAAVIALLLVASHAYVFYRGLAFEHAKWEAADQRQEATYLRGVERAAKIADRIEIKTVDRWHDAVKRGHDIEREVPVYVPPPADAACVVNRGFVRMHEAAVENAVLPAAAPDNNEAAPGVALSTVAGTVAENYTEFHAMRTQCEALQEWAREVSAASPAAADLKP